MFFVSLIITLFQNVKKCSNLEEIWSHLEETEENVAEENDEAQDNLTIVDDMNMEDVIIDADPESPPKFSKEPVLPTVST